MKSFLFVLAGLVCVSSVTLAQQPPGRAIGEVAAIDARQITLKTDQGETLTVLLAPETACLRVPPGEKDLKKAARIAASEIAAGDRVLARGSFSEDRKSLTAASVIVMTKSDLAQKHQRDREEWQRRGIAGTVTAVDAATGEITVGTPAREGPSSITIETGTATAFLRYAPDSIRFSDAKPSTAAELKVGDHLRALGDRTGGGARMKAEQIVFGSFRNLAATVVSVDAASGEIRVTDLDTHKPVTIRINTDSTLRRLPPTVAAMLARRFNPEARAKGGGPGDAPHQGEAPQPPRQWANSLRPGGGNGDLQQMLERMPALTVAELKQGDAVIVSSTRGADPARVTAITLVAGVEPLLTASPQGNRQLGGAWNFGDIGLPQ
jgi:preprotein translocase subunit YajC